MNILHSFAKNNRSGMTVFLLMLFFTLSACSRLDGPAPVELHGTNTPDITEGYQIKPGDTVYKISRITGVDMHALIDVNDLSPPYAITAGEEIILPKPSTYVVQNEDTLYGIAQAFNTTQTELARANNLKPPQYSIEPDQVLKIPSGYAPQSRSLFAEESVAATTSVPAEPVGERRSLVPPKVQSSDLAAPEKAKTQEQPQKSTRQTASLPPKKKQSKLPIKARPAPRESSQFAWPVQGSILSQFGPKENGQHNDGINIGAPRGTAVRAAENGVVVYNGDELQGFGNLLLIRHSDGWMTAYAHLDKAMVKRGDKVNRNQTIGAVGSTGNVDTPQLHFEIRKGSKAKNPKQFLGKT